MMPAMNSSAPSSLDLDRATVAYRTAFLRVSVQNELDRLNETRGEENAPMGGWRNTAVQTIAEREGMNPYTLDRQLRGA